jgi:hypothetical protein
VDAEDVGEGPHALMSKVSMKAMLVKMLKKHQ